MDSDSTNHRVKAGVVVFGDITHYKKHEARLKETIDQLGRPRLRLSPWLLPSILASKAHNASIVPPTALLSTRVRFAWLCGRRPGNG